ncbi:MAG: type IX secretion system sortase PorU, partial [Flavobacteriales bacterium]
SFIQATDSLRSFIGYNTSGFYEPDFGGKVEKQNLHGQAVPDLLLVYHPLFEQQVDRLKQFHESNGLEVLKVSVQEIYNEFSGGVQDVSAIKTATKMYYDRGGNKLKYLLLFGDCSYDYKGRAIPNHNFVPIWESANSLSDVSSFTTDDFYALLDDGESMGDYELMDIAVGRLTVTNTSQAQIVVNKIIHYQKKGTSAEALNCNSANSGLAFGDWRNRLTFSTDDVDANWELAFVNHTEGIIDSITKNYPTFNFNKVYMDAFNQTSASGGERYEEGAEKLKKSVQEGSLITNYEGHGGEIGWGSERFLDVPTINAWTNFDRLTVFLTATCEFAKFDDPARTSAGELCLLNNNGGAIALFTTTRPVYQFSNERLINAFFDVAFVKQTDGTPKTMGEIYRETKNHPGVIGDNNVRRFSLIGDPALNLAFPKNKVVTTEINNVPVSGNVDTLKALSKITIKGYVTDFSGSKLTSYNGYLFPTIYDKPQQLKTIGNRTPSDIIPFELQNNILYKGKATVKNGDFEFTFIVPKDINYQFGYGKISYYCFDGNEDGAGYFLDAVVGGTDLSAVADKEGPTLGLFMNDNNFVSGGITNETPSIYAEIFDSNGINTTGNGIGHDITAILDEKTSDPIILNSYYESDLDSYQSGKVNYPMEKLTEGNHTLSLKTWDTQNNSTEKSIDFVVVNKAELAIDHVLNYPNPFTTRTQFFFEHNQHCEFLEVQVQVFTVSGKLVKTLNQLVKTEGYRAEPIEWDGKDDFGDKIGRGTYVYKVKVIDNEGNKVEKYEKLVLLK